ncbi:MAG: hypothetical protein ACFFB0_21055 [Promethearchaeota archaeon]
MTSERKEEPTSKRSSIVRIIGFGLLIGGIILVIYGSIFLIRANKMFGDPEAPWWETVSTGSGLLAGGLFMILPAIFILFVSAQYRFLSRMGPKTFGLEDDYERYERIIQESSKARPSTPNRPVKVTPNEVMNGNQVVKIRCQLCGALNDEDAKFCDQCSQPL